MENFSALSKTDFASKIWRPEYTYRETAKYFLSILDEIYAMKKTEKLIDKIFLTECYIMYIIKNYNYINV